MTSLFLSHGDVSVSGEDDDGDDNGGDVVEDDEDDANAMEDNIRPPSVTHSPFVLVMVMTIMTIVTMIIITMIKMTMTLTTVLMQMPMMMFAATSLDLLERAGYLSHTTRSRQTVPQCQQCVYGMTMMMVMRTIMLIIMMMLIMMMMMVMMIQPFSK